MSDNLLQTLLTEDDKYHSHDAGASITAVPSTSSEVNPQYIIDTETGNLHLIMLNACLLSLCVPYTQFHAMFQTRKEDN